MPALDQKQKADYVDRFQKLCSSSVEDQTEFFLKAFIFVLGNSWKDVLKISTAFSKYCREGGEGRMDLNPVQAADFLQKHGLTRTASQRSAEIKDIDLNTDNRIAMIEYLLLHYKAMILREYYQRTQEDEVEDLSDGAIGVTGVGDMLLDQLFQAAVGLDPEIEKAIEELMTMKREKQKKIKELQEKADQGGVKGLAAKNEIEQIAREDPTELNRLEITLNAAKRKAAKSSGDIALKKKLKEDEEEKLEKLRAGRQKLQQKAALFEGK